MHLNPKFPQGPISNVKGKCIVLKGDDIDTDRIIPARFLKCVSFQALGNHVFADDRSELKGSHPFDREENKNTSILIVNENFGCGSSREHAPQALMRWGIRAIVGVSFAEIFFGNCLALGIPCASTSKENINHLEKLISINRHIEWEVDITNTSLISSLKQFKLYIDEGPLKMLLTGKWDATSQLIEKDYEINLTMEKLPYLNGYKNS